MWLVKLIVWIMGLGFAYELARRGLTRDKFNSVSGIRWQSAAYGVIMFFTAVALSSAFGQVPAGYKGVVVRFGAPTGKVLDQGFYAVWPPVITEVELMSIQTEAYATDADAGSHDLQAVHTKVTLNYSLDPSQVINVYVTLRRDYLARVIQPAIQESVKASTAQFSAEELITKRPQVKDTIERELRSRLQLYGIVVQTVSITNFDFSKAFNEAIEAKVTAQQEALKAENKLKQVQFEAQQKIATAQAEAESLRLQRQNVTEDLLRLRQIEAFVKWIEKWDGHMPSTYLAPGNGQSGMLFQLPVGGGR